MPWTEITREDYDRHDLRYASDLRDEEWQVIADLMPTPKRLGRPRKTDLRAVVDAIFYIAATGLPVAHAAEGLSTLQHGSELFL